MRGSGTSIFAIWLSLTGASCALASGGTIWADTAHTKARWISGEELNAALDPGTLAPRSGSTVVLDASEVAELRFQLEHFRDYRFGGWVTSSDVEAKVCPYRSTELVGSPLTDAPPQNFADVILESGEGFVAVAEVEGVEVGWSPASKFVTSLVTLRTVRPLWASTKAREVPQAFRILQTGGWLSLSGINICRAPRQDLGVLRESDLVLVWASVDDINPGVASSAHVLRIKNWQVTTICASCIPEAGLSVDQLEERLQGGKVSKP